MMEVSPDPRPPARHIASNEEWEAIIRAKAGPCRGCGELATEFHHLVARSQRGDDVAANIVPLCSFCHRVYTDKTPGWEDVAHAVRHTLTPAEIAYMADKKSKWWIGKAYPKGDTALCASCRKRLVTDEEREARKNQPPRPRKRWVVTVPDDAEDGADVMDALIDAHRTRLKPELGWSDDVGPYYVLAAVLSEAL